MFGRNVIRRFNFAVKSLYTSSYQWHGCPYLKSIWYQTIASLLILVFVSCKREYIVASKEIKQNESTALLYAYSWKCHQKLLQYIMNLLQQRRTAVSDGNEHIVFAPSIAWTDTEMNLKKLIILLITSFPFW